MSFSRSVKGELLKQTPAARHCQIAELTALICGMGRIRIDEQRRLQLKFHTDNEELKKHAGILVKKLFGEADLADSKTVYKLLETVKLLYPVEEILKKRRKTIGEEDLLWDGLIVQRSCCKRAFLRGLFLTSGSVNNPEKAYHLEMVFTSEAFADAVAALLRDMELEAKVTKRKKYHVVYLKDGSMIVDFLSNIGAPLSLMEMENIRIVKDVRNDINRRVNCETANIHKTVNAALKQKEDILLIEKTIGLNRLPQGLRQIAELRLAEPEATLQELGEMLTPPVSKSGVNHRLRKISQIAAEFMQ